MLHSCLMCPHMAAFSFTIWIQSEHASVLFGSPDLSAALIHIQWLVICYVVLNLYTHMHSDPLVIYIHIFSFIPYEDGDYCLWHGCLSTQNNLLSTGWIFSIICQRFSSEVHMRPAHKKIPCCLRTTSWKTLTSQLCTWLCDSAVHYALTCNEQIPRCVKASSTTSSNLWRHL